MKERKLPKCQICGQEDHEYGDVNLRLFTTGLDYPPYDKGYSYEIRYDRICRECGHHIGKLIHSGLIDVFDYIGSKASLKE